MNSRLNKWGRVVILIAVFTLFSSNAHGFLSPNTLSLMAASITSFVWGAIFFVAINIYLFYRKIGPQKILVGASILLLLVSSWFIVDRYILLKELNNVYDQMELREYEVDLNTLTPGEFNAYQRFQLKGKMSSTAWIKGSEQIIYLRSREAIILFQNSPDNFAELYNLSIGDRILIMDESGGSAQRGMRWLRDAGYDAYFARLSRLSEHSLLETTFEHNQRVSSALVVVPYEGQADPLYVDLDLYFDDHYLGEMFQEVEIKHHLNVSEGDLKGRTVICSVNLHCTLTKYLLDSKGIRRKKIHKMEVPETVYSRRL